MSQSEEGNTKSSSRYRRWCGTLNNYTSFDLSQLSHTFSEYKYIIGEEVGESGTPHLQIYIEHKDAIRLLTLKRIDPRIHWEACRGTREDNIKYCSKDGKFKTNFIIPKPLKLSEPWTQWQKDIENLFHTDPDDRTIHWYWEPNGKVGKSTFVKYMCGKYPDECTFSNSGRSADIVTLADPCIKMYIFDFPRTMHDHQPYNAIEQLKNGLVSDGKLKKKMRTIVMNSPHIICFANWPPNIEAMSSDRWNIIEIKT